MFRFLGILVYFIKELIFDDKEEYNIKSSSFNARKFIIFMMVVMSFGGNIIMTGKAITLAKNNILLREQLQVKNADCKK